MNINLFRGYSISLHRGIGLLYIDIGKDPFHFIGIHLGVSDKNKHLSHVGYMPIWYDGTIHTFGFGRLGELVARADL